MLCRAHPDRMTQYRRAVAPLPVWHGRLADVLSWQGHSSGWLHQVNAGYNTADDRTSGDWAGLIAMVLGLQEEGILREIMGYL